MCPSESIFPQLTIARIVKARGSFDPISSRDYSGVSVEIFVGEQGTWGGRVSLFLLFVGYNLLMTRGKGNAVGFCDGAFSTFY